jgi:hypothetical protein
MQLLPRDRSEVIRPSRLTSLHYPVGVPGGVAARIVDEVTDRCAPPHAVSTTQQDPAVMCLD